MCCMSHVDDNDDEDDDDGDDDDDDDDDICSYLISLERYLPKSTTSEKSMTTWERIVNITKKRPMLNRSQLKVFTSGGSGLTGIVKKHTWLKTFRPDWRLFESQTLSSYQP